MFCLMLYIKGYLYVYREKTIKLLFLEIARIILIYNPIDRYTVNVLKFQPLLFLFSTKMMIFRVGIHNRVVRIAKREDPDQTASALFV